MERISMASPFTNQDEDKKNGPISVMSLEQLIAEIDSETGEKPIPDEKAGEKAVSPLSASEAGYRRERYIRFYLNDMLMAIPLQSATEIGHRPLITPLPNLPDWVLGVSNIRGEIVSIVDLKSFLGLPSHGVLRDRRFVITHTPDMKVGLVVDRIMDILTGEKITTDIQESPYEEGEISTYISGIIATEDNVMNILDIDKLLTSPRMTAFRAEG